MTQTTDVVVIGAGLAGLACAKHIVASGLSVKVFEKNKTSGGHVAQWHKCFPFDRTGQEIINEFNAAGIELITNTSISTVMQNADGFEVNGVSCRAVVVATGFNLFDASLKEELGYGVYPRVLTSADLEDCWREGRQPFDVSDTDAPRFAVVHCVGSRDLKCNVTHCSKVCCMAAVKAATELKEHYPTCQVTNYYMDLRMFDTAYEELYLSAQTQSNVQFVRGRVSEISIGNLGRLKLKSEDTLLGTPIADRVHGVVLMVGMQPAATPLVDGCPMPKNNNGFLATASSLNTSATATKGVFVAGACRGPRTINETIAEAKAAALAVIEYLNH